jgi:hypothetical protein
VRVLIDILLEYFGAGKSSAGQIGDLVIRGPREQVR